MAHSLAYSKAKALARFYKRDERICRHRAYGLPFAAIGRREHVSGNQARMLWERAVYLHIIQGRGFNPHHRVGLSHRYRSLPRHELEAAAILWFAVDRLAGLMEERAYAGARSARVEPLRNTIEAIRRIENIHGNP